MPHGIEDLRRNMFHGPLFQMIRTLDRTGREGIEGTLEVQPRDGVVPRRTPTRASPSTRC